jgi:hypothetical protein
MFDKNYDFDHHFLTKNVDEKNQTDMTEVYEQDHLQINYTFLAPDFRGLVDPQGPELWPGVHLIRHFSSVIYEFL